MEQELKQKISEAMSETFVGNYIFTNDELTLIYDEAGRILRNVGSEWGEEISYLHYELIFVAIVNLAKEWNSDEDAFFDFIYRRLLGSMYGGGKIYTQITKIIQKLFSSQKIFLLNSYTKKYYASLCSHSFAPLSSIESFFELCWIIYCNDLDQQYEKNDPVFSLICQSLKNKLNAYGTNEDDFTIGSKVYSIRAGVRGLTIDQPNLMVELLELVISSINSLFNNEPIKNDKYINVLISNWWKEKELTFGIEKARNRIKAERTISDYSQIKAKYMLENGTAKIILPSIRLLDNFDYDPYIEIKVDGNRVICEKMETKGSGILLSTKQVEYDLASFPITKAINVSIEITHCDKVIYNSKESLYREFIVFKDSKEITSPDCLPGIYFIYTPSIDTLLQYPADIHRIGKNTYSFEASEGDILQSNEKTIFFINEKTNRELYFVAKERNDAIFRYQGEEYKVVDGDLYVDIAITQDVKKYGVKYETTAFKLEDFSQQEVCGKNRYNVSMLLNVGEPQRITIFKYSDNSIVANINLIKFNDINITFDKELYYGKGESGTAVFKTQKYNLQNHFSITSEEVLIPLEKGEVVLRPPVLRWKIDDGEWQTQEKTDGIWYKHITNSSVLYLDLPKTMGCDVWLTNNAKIEPFGNEFKYKLGQTIYALKENTTSSLDYFMVLVKTSNGILYEIADIYYKETFIEEPLLLFPSFGQYIWNPISFIGDNNSCFRLDIFNESNERVYSKELSTQPEKSSIYLAEGYYSYKITLLHKGFLQKETILLSKTIIYGNEKNLKFKDKAMVIREVMLFDGKQPTSVRPLCMDNIKFLGEKNNYDFYSGLLYLISRDGRKTYLNKMTNEKNEIININPVRIEIKSDNSCYLGYGLDEEDEEFEYDSEFCLDSFGKITVCQRTNGQKNKGIDYFRFEVRKNV